MRLMLVVKINNTMTYAHDIRSAFIPVDTIVGFNNPKPDFFSSLSVNAIEYNKKFIAAYSDKKILCSDSIFFSSNIKFQSLSGSGDDILYPAALSSIISPWLFAANSLNPDSI